jgi:hypothetical protein
MTGFKKGDRVGLTSDPTRIGVLLEVDSDHVTFGATTTRILWDDLAEFHGTQDMSDIQWTNRIFPLSEKRV